MTEVTVPAAKKSVMLVGDQRIDRRVLDEARYQIRAGWDVMVIAGKPPHHGFRTDEETYPDVPIVRIGPGTPALAETIDKDRFATALSLSPPGDWDALFPGHGFFSWKPLPV